MPVVGRPRVFHKKFAFVVEIEKVASAAFTKCSELSSEVAKVEQWEGGKVIPDKSPGRVTMSDVTLERGVASGDFDLPAWFKQVINVSANSGLATPAYKRPVDIIQLERDASELRRHILDNAWPTKLVVGEWDNEADENVVENVTLTFDTFDTVQLGG